MTTEQLTIETIKTAEFKQKLMESVKNTVFLTLYKFRAKKQLKRNEEAIIAEFSKEIEKNLENTIDNKIKM